MTLLSNKIISNHFGWCYNNNRSFVLYMIYRNVDFPDLQTNLTEEKTMSRARKCFGASGLSLLLASWAGELKMLALFLLGTQAKEEYEKMSILRRRNTRRSDLMQVLWKRFEHF